MWLGQGRVYDPSEGRFGSRNPIQEDPTSLYNLVGDPPTYGTDPSGMEPQDNREVFQRPSCIAYHGTGLVTGQVQLRDLSPSDPMAVLRWVSGSYRPLGDAAVGVHAVGQSFLDNIGNPCSWGSPDVAFWADIIRAYPALKKVPEGVETIKERPGHAAEVGIGIAVERTGLFGRQFRVVHQPCPPWETSQARSPCKNCWRTTSLFLG
jgi:hypothetical protein